jgi:hypothetical protein
MDVTSTADHTRVLRDSNSEAYEKYKDQYFLGTSVSSAYIE